MPKEIEFEEEAAPKNKGGRPRKTDADVIFGDEIDSNEERRLQEEVDIQNMLQREDANATTIIVSRRMTSAQKFAHLSEIGIRDYSREDIANQYGGGQYRCRVRRSDGQFGHTWYFDIDMSRKPESVDGVQAGTPTGVDAVRLVETMAEKFGGKSNQNNELFAAMSAKSDDMFKMMIMMQQENTKLIAGMMQAMASRPQPAPDTAMAQMSTMLLKHSLDQSQTRMDDMISTIQKLKRMSEDDAPEQEDGESGGSFIKDIMSAIPQIMQQVFKPQPQQLPPGQAQPPAAPVPVAPSGAMDPSTMSPQERIAMAVAGILQQADAGVPPEVVYRGWAPLLNEEDTRQIKEFLQGPDWMQNLCTLFPSAAANRDWVEKFRNIIVTEEVEVEETDAQPVIGVGPLNGARRVRKAKSKKG